MVIVNFQKKNDKLREFSGKNRSLSGILIKKRKIPGVLGKKFDCRQILKRNTFANFQLKKQLTVSNYAYFPGKTDGYREF